MSTELIKESVDNLIKANPECDILIISHEINRSLYYTLSKKLEKIPKKRAKCLVFIYTLGGDPHAGFRIARCLKYHFECVRLIVPHRCKSAGTLIAIGADQIAIGNLGELGPLDVQINKRTEMMESSSGLDYTEALQAMHAHAESVFRSSILDIRAGAGISTKMAGEFASQLAIGMVSQMYAQIDPIQVGEVHRAMKIAYEYGERLNNDSKQLKTDALVALVSGYPDHSFVIDRKEAETLFKNITHTTAEEDEFSATLWGSFFKREADNCVYIDCSSRSATGDANENSPPQASDDQIDSQGVGHDENCIPKEVDGGFAAGSDGTESEPDKITPQAE